MSLFLKNYTSDVPVPQTIHRIEQVLIKCGVSGIMKHYDSRGQVVALTFKIELANSEPWTVRLPANVQKAWDALWLNYANGDRLSADGMKLEWSPRKKLVKAHFKDQAERTAWKIVQDWIEVQMSLIQLGQAEFREIFLPYIWDGKQTLFQRLNETGFKALIPERCE